LLLFPLLFDSELFYLVDIVWHEYRTKHASTDDETVVKHKHMYKMDSKIVKKENKRMVEFRSVTEMRAELWNL
jgi:hypothetical protein